MRCKCPNCGPHSPTEFPSAQHYQFTTMAKYTGELAATIRSVLPDIPLYVNSPWWPPFAAEIMLKYGGIDLVGSDGVLSSFEPGNVLGTIQVEVTLPDGSKKKNIGFASECPTENEKTTANLDVLNYYTIFGPYLGIGAMLW